MADVYRHQEGTPDRNTQGPTAMNPGVIPSGGLNPLTVNDNAVRGDSSPINPSDWRSTARTSWGAPVAVHEINDQTIVEIGGQRDTVAAFKITGQLPTDLSQAPQVAPQEPQLGPQEDGPKEDRPPVPKDARDLWEATEATVVPLLEQTGTLADGAVEALITQNGDVLSGVVQDMASLTGTPPEELRETVTRAFESYQDVARRAVGMSSQEWALFSEFCNDRADERAEAARDLFHKGDLSGVRKLAQAYRQAPYGGLTDATAYRLIIAAGGQASRSGNTTMITLNGQSMPWRQAADRGLLEIA